MKTDGRFTLVLPAALLLAAGLVAVAGDRPAPLSREKQRQAGTAGATKPADANADGSASAAAAAPAGDTTVPTPRAPFAPPVKKTPAGKNVVVITNGDLERMYGKSRQQPQRAAAGTTPGDEFVEGLPGSTGAAPPPPGSNAADVQAEITRLEQKAKHIKNPYVTPVRETPQEREAERGLGAAEKLQATQKRIEQLKQDLKNTPPPPPGQPPQN